MLSPMLLYITCICTGTHTHTGEISRHCLGTKDLVVLGKKYRRVAGKFPSHEQLLIQQSRDLHTFRALSTVPIKVSAVR